MDDGAVQILAKCTSVGGKLSADAVACAVADSTVQLGEAEEQAASALLACQKQLLAEECGQARLSSLRNHLDSLISTVAQKGSTHTNGSHDDDQAMHHLAQLHQRAELLGAARRAVQVVQLWKASIGQIDTWKLPVHSKWENDLEGLESLWSYLASAQENLNAVAGNSWADSASGTRMLTQMEAKMQSSLQSCISGSISVIEKWLIDPFPGMLGRLISITPAAHQAAVLAAVAPLVATCTAVSRSDHSWKPSSEFISMPAGLVDAGVRYWAIVACAQPITAAISRDGNWQQVMRDFRAGSTQEGPSLEKIRQNCLSCLSHSGISLPSASSQPLSLNVSPKLVDAIESAAGLTTSREDSLAAVHTLSDAMKEALSAFHRRTCECIATACLLQGTDKARGDGPEQAALQHATALAAISAWRPLMGLIHVRWLGSVLLATACRITPWCAPPDCLRGAVAHVAPLAAFLERGGAQTWAEAATDLGMDVRVSVLVLSHQLQYVLHTCLSEARAATAQLAGGNASPPRSRGGTGGTDMFGEDEVGSEGEASAVVPDSGPQCDVALSLLLAATVLGIQGHLYEQLPAAAVTQGTHDLENILQSLYHEAQSFLAAQDIRPALSDLAHHVAAAQPHALQSLSTVLADEIGSDASGARGPAVFNSSFTSELRHDCIGLLWVHVDRLLASARSPLVAAPPSPASGDAAAASVYSLQPSGAIVDACHAFMHVLRQCSPSAFEGALKARQDTQLAAMASLAACLEFAQDAQAKQWADVSPCEEDEVPGPSASSPALSRAVAVSANASSGQRVSHQDEAAALAGLVVYCCGERLQAHILEWFERSHLSSAQREVDVEHVESFLSSVGLVAHPLLLKTQNSA